MAAATTHMGADALELDQHGRTESPEPTRDEISRLAHSYWLERREEDGTPEGDWYRAEEYLKTLARSSS